MEGISHEAGRSPATCSSMKLMRPVGRQQHTIDGATDSFTDDTLKRFAAYGWAVGGWMATIAAEVDAARLGDALSKPALIACRTIIGFRRPTKAGTDGQPRQRRRARGKSRGVSKRWMAPPRLSRCPTRISRAWEAVGRRVAAPSGMAQAAGQAPDAEQEFGRATAGKLPEAWQEPLEAFRGAIAEGKPKWPTRKAPERRWRCWPTAVPEMIGGSADLSGSHQNQVRASFRVTPGDYTGRYIH